MRYFCVVVLCVFVLVSCAIFGSREPEEHPDLWSYTAEELYEISSYLFDDTVVRKVEIEVDPEIFRRVVRAVYAEGRQKFYGLAESFSFDGEKVNHVGLRSRGGMSLGNHKRQFKVSFNAHTTFTDRGEQYKVYNPALHGRSFHGVRSLNFRASSNDPSIIRDHVASYIFHAAGAMAPRTAFAEVYINGEYWGLYIITEQIDRTLVHSRMGERRGILAKGIRAKSRFVPEYADEGFSLKSKHHDDLEELRDFFRFLQEGVSEPGVLRDHVNIDNVLGYLAAASLIGHWDSFAYLENNDYLYKHSDGRYHIIGWDFDNTFGSGKGWGFSTLNKSIFRMHSNANYHRLFDRIFEHPEWRQQYINKVTRLLDEVYNYEHLQKKIMEWVLLIEDSVLRDPRRHSDWKVAGIGEANTVWEESFYGKSELWFGYQNFGSYDKGLLGWIKERHDIVRAELAGLAKNEDTTQEDAE